MQNTITRNTITLPQEGMTLMGFLGGGNAVRSFFGESQRYLFGGKKHMVGNVLDSDVDILLGKHENGKPLFEIVKTVKMPALKPVVQTKPEQVPDVIISTPDVINWDETKLEEEAVTPKRTRKKKTDAE